MKPRSLGNLAESHPLLVKDADLIEGLLPRTPMRMTDEMLVLRDVPMAAWTTKIGRAIFVLAACRRRQRATRRSTGPAQLPLDRLSEILQEMKSEGELPGLRSPFTRALGEQTAPISTDDFDLGAASEPIGRRGGRAIRKHVHDFTRLKIHYDGAVCAAFAPTPIVDARHPNRCRRIPTRDPALQMSEDCVVADWRAQTSLQPFSRLPAGAMPK